jgi:transposase-like protein
MVRNTSGKKVNKYARKIRETAIWIFTDGLNFRDIGRHLKISHTTVMEWVREHAEKLPGEPQGSHRVIIPG